MFNAMLSAVALSEAPLDLGSQDSLMQLGTGCVIILVLDRVVNIVRLMANRQRSEDAPSQATAELRELVSDIQTKTRDLHNWHNRRDEDGVFLWNVPRSLEKSIRGLTESIERNAQGEAAQTEMLKSIRRRLDDRSVD